MRGLYMMIPGHHRDWGFPGVWEHQGLPTSGQDLAARAHLIPQPGAGMLGDTGVSPALDIGLSLGKVMAIVSPWMYWSSGPDLVMVPRGHTALGWTCECSQDPDCQCRHLMLCCQYTTGSKLVLFPHFRFGPDMDQSLARPVLHYVLSKFSAGCGPGSNFPAIFPAVHWSALNVAFILL